MTIETDESMKTQKKGKQQTFSKDEIVKMWKVKGFCFIGCVQVYK